MKRLRQYREARNLSVRQLAGMTGVHYVSIVRLEGGKFDPRLSTLRKLAQALEVSVCDLIDQPQLTKGGSKHGTHKTKGRVVRRVSSGRR
ncbi:MAG: helix-turn-helix transcriptional regulator [Nitrospira sp.]|nr:helix-turn-helix transcriptional regulator [Nitrospira sp.]